MEPVTEIPPAPDFVDVGRDFQVRTAAVVLTIREIEDGGLVLTAIPHDGVDLVADGQEQGRTWRARIRTRSSAVRP